MGEGAYRFPGLKARTRAKYAQLIDPIREVARKCGYAVGVHGSLARDIDLIAIPWTREAVSGNELAARIIRMVKRRLGRARKNAEWHERRGGKMVPTEAFFRGHIVEPTRDARRRKPHGRRAWSIHLGGGPYIDLSVMPRRR